MGNDKDQFTIKDLVAAAQAKLEEARDLRDGKKGRKIVAEHEQHLKKTIDFLDDFVGRANREEQNLCPQLFYLDFQQK